MAYFIQMTFITFWNGFFFGSLKKTIGLLFVLLFSSGCGARIPTYTRTKPVIDDLVGTWTIDLHKSTVPFSFGPEIEKARLLLFSDGSFDAIGLPREGFDGTEGKENVTGHGKWTVKKHVQGWWDIQLEWPVRSDTHIIHFETLHICNCSPEHLLYATIDDPDLGHAIVFQRYERCLDSTPLDNQREGR